MENTNKKAFSVDTEKAKLVQEALKDLQNDTLNDLSAEFISGGAWVKAVLKFKSDGTSPEQPVEPEVPVLS